MQNQNDTKATLYDTEKRMVEETVLERPGCYLTDGDWRDVTDPQLKIELLTRYLRQEHLWFDDTHDFGARAVSSPAARSEKWLKQWKPSWTECLHEQTRRRNMR